MSSKAPEERHAVRQAVASDAPQLWEVRYAVTENTLAPGRISDAELLDAIERTGRGWVVEERGTALGFAVGNAQTGNVWALFVRPSAQGRGIGHALHNAMLAWFGELPLERLWLSTGRNTRARLFYEKHGWIQMGPHGSEEWRYERANLPR